MKKVYLFFVAFFALMSLTPMNAKDVVTARGNHLTSLSELQEGQKILLFCYGETSRRAYAMETGEVAPEQIVGDGYMNRVKLSRNLEVGDISSSDYVWTILSCENVGDAVNVTLASPRGNYFPNFPENEGLWGTWSRWQGYTGSEPASITITQVINEDGDPVDSLYYLMDENGVYFNGQNIGNDGTAGFVGWNSSGSNSMYIIYLPTVEERNTLDVTCYLSNADGSGNYLPNIPELFPNDVTDDTSVTFTSAVGASFEAPSIEHWTFVNATDMDEEPVELPYVITEDDVDAGILELNLFYERWPLVTVTCEDEEGNELLSYEQWYEKGSVFAPKADSEVGLGYALVTKDYEDFIVDEDMDITLVYHFDPTIGLPFEVTTVSDGKFAEGTKYYMLAVREGYAYAQDENPDDPSVDVTDVKVTGDWDPTDIDRYLWAITGNLSDGFTFYNKLKGPSYKLYVDGTGDGTSAKVDTEENIAEMEAAVTLFNVAKNQSGFSISAAGDANACLNRYGGTSGTDLKIWNNGNSPVDVGSRFVFYEITDEEANDFLFSAVASVLGTENCVGGYTTAQLADVKAAYEAKNLAAANDAIEALDGEETIAFDASKTYNLVSACRYFNMYQPGTDFAMYVDATDSLRWNELVADDAHYQWVFTQVENVNDTIYYTMTPLSNPKQPIAGFRWGGIGTIYTANVAEKGENDIVAAGDIATFYMAPCEANMAAFRFVHNYGASIITLSGGTNTFYTEELSTSGNITTYNTSNSLWVPNTWRLRPVGDVPTSINGVEAGNNGDAGNVIYDLSGRAVKKAVKGIYIVNGKKVLVP